MSIAWEYLNKKNAAVDALKDYASMAFVIRNHMEDWAEAEEKLVSVGSSLPTGMPKGRNVRSRESHMAASIDKIDVMKERYRRATEFMKWFQPAWDELSNDERFVLSSFYLGGREDNDSVGNICEKYHIERSSAYNKKNRALKRLTLNLYGSE